MKKSSAVKLITTYYPGNTDSDKVRASLAIKLIKNAKECGYKIIVVDY